MVVIESVKVLRWTKQTDGYTYWYGCPYCGQKVPKDAWGNNYYSPYCPECGNSVAPPSFVESYGCKNCSRFYAYDKELTYDGT